MAKKSNITNHAEITDMVWWKQILLGVAVSVPLIPLIWLYIDYDYHRAPRYIPPPQPTAYEGTIDLDTGHFRIEKR